MSSAMIGLADVRGKRHAVRRASEDPNCPDGDKGKLFAACDSSLRVFLDPTTKLVTCQRCLRLAGGKDQ